MKCIALVGLSWLAIGRCSSQQTVVAEGPNEDCRWIHGHLQTYNGTPTLRVWEVGTHHLFGLGTNYESLNRCKHCDPDAPDLPPNVERVFEGFKTVVWGEFEVCPLAPYKSGHMQPAHLISASNLVVKGDDALLH
jgi:hypothetical protein